MPDLATVLAAEVAAGRTIAVMEPPGGLTAVQRRAIERAVQMMADGRQDKAEALLALCGFDLTVERVKDGRLEPV